MIRLLAILVGFLALLRVTLGEVPQPKLALAAESGSTFFDPVFVGFEERCTALVGKENCMMLSGKGFRENGTASDCVDPYEIFVPQLMEWGADAIALKPCGDDVNFSSRILDKYAGAPPYRVPLVYFDSDRPDDPSPQRIAYVGTDQVFMGRTMARLTKQLNPVGGTYALVCDQKTERASSFIEEITRDNNRTDRPHWYQVPQYVDRDTSVQPSVDGYMAQMQAYAKQNPTAMLFFCRTPMSHPNWTDFVTEHRSRNITYIGTDGSDFQLDYLHRRFVDGLIGQLPFEFGSLAAETMYNFITLGKAEESVIPTNLVSYNLIPIDLPQVQVNQNLTGNLRIAGFVCFSLIALYAIICALWTIFCRRTVIVKAAQPLFLVMVALGVLVMSSSLIPLSFDDDGNPDAFSETFKVGICMSIPWLGFIGFTITFSALFAKTWRINKLFLASQRYTRIELSLREVLPHFTVLLALNFIVLICWTVIDPLTYVREFERGTDYWNREFESNGYCRSDNSVAYLVPLGVINFAVLVFACVQAYQGRYIKSDFSESSYIGLAVFSMAQAFLTGIPLVVVVRDVPQAFYLVLTFLIFILCMTILSLIFIPKFLNYRVASRLSEADQMKQIRSSIRRSVNGVPSSAANQSSTCPVCGTAMDGSASFAHVPRSSGVQEERGRISEIQEIPSVPEDSDLTRIRENASNQVTDDVKAAAALVTAEDRMEGGDSSSECQPRV